MAGVKLSEYTELASLVGDEKIPTGTGVRKATTPNQLKAFIGNSASKLTDLTDVDAGAAGSADGKFLTEVAPVAGERQFGFVDATVAVGDVVGLQAELDTKEATIAAGTTSDYYRGDKTFQLLNKTAVGLPNVDNTSDLNKPISTLTQTALDTKLSNLTSPAATGTALHMAKSGTNGQLKRLIAGQDINLTEASDAVTISSTGRTLKDFTEVSETVNGKFYRYLSPNASANPTTQPVHIKAAGRSSINSDTFSFAITDATTAFKPNTGSGSIDLQITRDAVTETASGTNNFVAGRRVTVTGSNNSVISKDLPGIKTVVTGDFNTILGAGQNISGGGNCVLGFYNNVTGTNNFILGGESTAGSGNLILGNGMRNTGNYCSGIQIGSSFDSQRSTRGMSYVHTQSTSAGVSEYESGQQNLYAMYQRLTVGGFNTKDWITLTSDRLAVGTTNVYILATGVGVAVAFSGHIVIGRSSSAVSDPNIYKIEGAYSSNDGVAWTVTPLIERLVDLFDIRVLVSAGKLLFQVKVKAGQTALTAYDEARANIQFSELSGSN